MRVEQLYPFPSVKVKAIVDELKPDEVVWAQEEPRNMGAWSFVAPVLKGFGIDARYVGRVEAASPATGSHKRHQAEQQAIVDGALG